MRHMMVELDMFDLLIPLGGLEHPELLEESCSYTVSGGTGGSLVLCSYDTHAVML
jgi:hypothetical protein